MNKRFHVLDGFRGIFALIVAIYHFKPGPGYLGHLRLIENGWFFVDFFFVLSGFVILYNYPAIKTYAQQKDFVIKRLLRLYPLHIAMLFVFLFFEGLKYLLYSSGHFNNPPFKDENLASFIANVFMVQSYGLPIESLKHLSWNTPSWSISAEFFSYIIFCAVIPLIINSNKVQRILVFVSLTLVSLALLYIVNNGSLSLKIGAHFGIFRCSYSFFLGCVVCELYTHIYQRYERVLSQRVVGVYFSVLEILIVSITLFAVSYLPHEQSYIAPLLFFVCIFVFSFELGYLSKLLTNNLIQQLGKLSYSIYMVNAFVTILFEIVLLRIVKINNPIVYDLMIFPYLISIIFCASLSYKYFEIKGKAVMQRLLAKSVKVFTLVSVYR
ncbi:acyltransferase family protein [Spirosoma fluviale]|uniref:Peptidoglycan/LPS O-acetylase OafA/YrhL, contains acyltransferase and SGNH-hydrolase domains n=1 Tax=Spirosoma fluviale TaxID=1597977 RepID=A0A286G8H8_9BACT|nr:acyltransferase [Spirosoma fluviale]SOD91821.1 Peptidoglycan/LPS O-acetylase OafA/YrhL, contains acyltransferase and SGNH-hydrolase domains [Spirosoma fluviale]